MKRRIFERGNAHIVIIIVLIIALFAALGIVFYQNFVAKKDDSSSQTTTKTAGDDTVTARTAFESSIYAVDYPKSWTVKTEDSKDIGTDGSGVVVTNKNQTVKVNLAINATAPNTACDANDGLSISYYNVYPAAVTKLADETLYTVEAMYDNVGGGYHYVIGLTPDGGDTHAAVGDTHCNVAQVGQAAQVLFAADGKTLVHPTVTATITFPKLTKKEGDAVPEMQVVKDVLSTDDYKTAVKILESARKE